LPRSLRPLKKAVLVPSCSVEGFQYRGSELTGPLCLMVQGSMLGVTDLFVEVDWMASMMASDVRVDWRWIDATLV
jgi:hypothetical protein